MTILYAAYQNIGNGPTDWLTVLFNFLVKVVFNSILFNWNLWMAVIAGIIIYFLASFFGRPRVLKESAYDALYK